MVKVKICGITRAEDAQAALEAGADFLGFNFYPGSPRCVSVERAGEMAAHVPPDKAVALFVDPDREMVLRVMERTGISIVQIQGEEPPEFCRIPGARVIKGFRLGESADLDSIKDYQVWAVLADAKTGLPGGSGKLGDWELSARARGMCERLFLAGGLDPGNVAEAIKAVRPWAVDVCSGVESGPGVKDPAKIREFIRMVKDAG